MSVKSPWLCAMVAALAISRAASAGTGEVLTTPLNASGYQITSVGAVTTQGDAAMNAAAARSLYGLTGSGIKIGVISDSYNSLGGAAANVTSGDLPSGVTVINDATGTDEGRAMLQIVHDVAPGAQLLFHSAFNNTQTGAPGQSIADAINALRAAGANVIVDDVAYRNEPWFQDGPAAQAVKAAHDAGVAYFSSAGNFGTNSYQGAFTNSGFQLFAGSGIMQDFNHATVGSVNDLFLRVSVPNGRTLISTLEWDDPYNSVSPLHSATADYDMYFLNTAHNTLLAVSGRDQLGGSDQDGDGVPDWDPYEIAGYQNTTGSTLNIDIAVTLYDGSPNHILKLILGDGITINDTDATNSPTIVGHAAAEGGIAVAAQPYFSLNSVESFSSRGSTSILFNPDGTPTDILRNTPQLIGPDGVSTTGVGANFNSFFGTSAAAPHIAAAAALLMERANDLGVNLSVDQLYNILETTAIDVGPTGYDTASGYGRLDLVAAVEAIAIPEPSSFMLLVSSAAFVRFRRRV